MARKKPRIELSPAEREFCERETVRLLPLVERLAHRSRLPFPIEDLVQEGAMAVFEALPRWDPSKNVKLETWLHFRVIGALRDYARRMGRLLQGGQRTGRQERIVSIDAAQYETESGKSVGLDLRDSTPTKPPADRWNRVLRGLNKRERIIVLEYFVAGRTLKEIAADVGVSESRVSQQLGGILARLKEHDRHDGRVRELVA